MRILKSCIYILAVLLGMSLAILKNVAYAEEQQRDYFDAYFTTAAAAACQSVYLENENTDFSFLKSTGWNVAPYVSRTGALETHFIVADKKIMDNNRHLFLVAFRGSATKNDWKINLKTKKVNYGGKTLTEMENIAELPVNSNTPSVHGGFNTYALNVLNNSVINNEGQFSGVFGYAYENPNCQLILTGHSMGGAVATLVATRLVDLGFPKERLKVITFGAPAIGNVAYNEVFANKLDILRITNTNDPVPGSLQTFFNGYTQCGRNLKYHLSAQVGNMQHDMAMYVDHSVVDLYRVKDEKIASGYLVDTASSRHTPGVPTVALWIKESPGLQKMPTMPPIQRLLKDQYARILPSYVLMDDDAEIQGFQDHNKMIAASAKAGADYVLIFSIDGRRDKSGNGSWAITLEQSIYRADGQMLSVAGYAKKVAPAIGNVQAAGENCYEAFKELREKMPDVFNRR